MVGLRSLYVWVLLVLGLAAQSAMSGPLLVLAPGDRASFSAVGVIRASGSKGVTLCSGTLVARDLVVTSAHCFRNTSGLLDSVEFVAGLHGSRFIANSGSVEVHTHPVWSKTRGRSKFRYDVAVVRLSRPVSGAKVQPLRLASQRVNLPEQGAMMGYAGRTSGTALHGRLDCSFSDALNSGLFTSDCHATRGNSGGPVLAKGPNGWELAGVIVASRHRTQEAVVIELDDWLRQHVTEALDREALRLAQLQ